MTTIAALSDIVSSDGVLEPDSLGPISGSGRAPDCVVRPGSSEEVAGILRWASRERVGVLPVASGRRAPAVHREGRWIALSTAALSGIEMYEPADLTVTAGAGTPMSEVDVALRGNRQWVPFDPPVVQERSLGGLVADGASGPLWMGYGELRNHVLGVTLVTGDGRVLRLGGRVVKNVAGFDLIRPVTGSRGTLGIMTSVCLRAFPVPAVDRVLTLEAPTVEELLPHALRVGTAPILPVSCAVIRGPDDRRGARMVVRLHGAQATVDADERTLEEWLGVSLEPVEDPAARDELLGRVRDGAWEGGTTVEASASPSALGELLAAVRPLAPGQLVVDPYAARIRVLLPTVDSRALRRAAAAAAALGGALRVTRTGDPEVAALGTAPGPTERRLIQKLRSAFDPHGVLRPAGGFDLPEGGSHV